MTTTQNDSRWYVVQTHVPLRLHPAIIALRERFAESNKRHKVELTDITSHGLLYHASRKGVAKSGRVTINIGVHFFDMLCFVFGPASRNEAHLREAEGATGSLGMPVRRHKLVLLVPEPQACSTA